jgi:hypothetical protein
MNKFAIIGLGPNNSVNLLTKKGWEVVAEGPGFKMPIAKMPAVKLMDEAETKKQIEFDMGNSLNRNLTFIAFPIDVSEVVQEQYKEAAERG